MEVSHVGVPHPRGISVTAAERSRAGEQETELKNTQVIHQTWTQITTKPALHPPAWPRLRPPFQPELHECMWNLGLQKEAIRVRGSLLVVTLAMF